MKFDTFSAAENYSLTGFKNMVYSSGSDNSLLLLYSCIYYFERYCAPTATSYFMKFYFFKWNTFQKFDFFKKITGQSQI